MVASIAPLHQTPSHLKKR